MEEEQKINFNEKTKIAWSFLPLKAKLIIIACIFGFFITIIFIVMMITPLMSLGIIDIKDLYGTNNGFNGTEVFDSSKMWWPIGSNDVTTKNGIDYALGDPISSTITSPFGRRNLSGSGSFHKGIDIGTSDWSNTYIIASGSGKVIYPSDKNGSTCPHTSNINDSTSSCGGGFGNYVMIEHDNGMVTLYAHMSANTITVSSGDNVKQGQIIGKMGSSGRSTGPHLHFEIRLNGQSVDPENYVNISNPRPKSELGYVDMDDGITNKDEVMQNICLSLKKSNFSDYAVAGIMANIAGEGFWNSTNLEDCYENNRCCTVNGNNYGYCVTGNIIGKFGSDKLYTDGVDSGNYPRSNFISDRAGYGLIQWTSESRKANLYDFAKKNGKSIGSVELQMNFCLNEIRYGGFNNVWDKISNSQEAGEIAGTFCKEYESPAFSCDGRINNAKEIYLPYVKRGCK